MVVGTISRQVVLDCIRNLTGAREQASKQSYSMVPCLWVSALNSINDGL